MVWFRRTRNLKRRIFKKPLGFVHLRIEGDLPIIREPETFIRRQLLPQAEFSVMELFNQSHQLMETGRVSGLLIELVNIDGGYAAVELLIDLIRLWQDHDFPVWIYANSYDFQSYYLATQADRIFITPGGTLNTIGLSLTTSFYREFLEDYGLTAQVAQVTPFKSAGNSFVYDEMPEEQRKNLNWLADGIFDQIVTHIAKHRNTDENTVKTMIDNSPLPDTLAVNEGWIDANLSANQIRQKIDEEFDTDLTDFKEAMGRIPIAKKRNPNIAIIPVMGSIVDGKSSQNNFPIPFPLLGDENAGDITITQMIRQVRQQDSIQACVLLVNSPGGSATASESILQEFRQLADKMPLVVYFHDVAASGGYYISMAADYIISQPLTITASIGVINAKISTDEFYKKRGINRVTIKRGLNSTIEGTVGIWTEDQKAIVHRSMDRIYDRFKEHVIGNRDLSLTELEKIAGGRVYVGHQALDLKLVDELGGLHRALDKAAELADQKDIHYEVIGAPKKIIPPEAFTNPRLIRNYLLAMSGKPQLLPYLIFDDLMN